MKAEFLKELGLEHGTIDKIMAENEKDIAVEQCGLFGDWHGVFH